MMYSDFFKMLHFSKYFYHLLIFGNFKRFL